VCIVQMLVVDVYNHRFHKVFSPNDSLTQIMDRDDIFVCVMFLTPISRFLLTASSNKKLVFTARCYASAVYAVMQCPSVCPSICHVRGSRQNE